jgi:hypothetical protein
MAKTPQMTYPLDTPRVNDQGLLAPERDMLGNAKWLTMPPEAPVRAAKGDLGLSYIQDLPSRPLTSPGLPFILKR